MANFKSPIKVGEKRIFVTKTERTSAIDEARKDYYQGDITREEFHRIINDKEYQIEYTKNLKLLGRL